MRQRIAVGIALATKIMPLDSPAKPLTIVVRDIHLLTHREQVRYRQLRADSDTLPFALIEAELPESASGLHSGFGQVADGRFVDTTGASVAGSHLQSPIAVSWLRSLVGSRD